MEPHDLLCVRPTRDYTTRLRYIEALITEQLTAARQRAVQGGRP
jgi:hypothetical protein